MCTGSGLKEAGGETGKRIRGNGFLRGGIPLDRILYLTRKVMGLLCI
jgi:hypothetical protein